MFDGKRWHFGQHELDCDRHSGCRMYDKYLSFLSLLLTCSSLHWTAPLASLCAFCFVFFFFAFTHPEYSINFYDCNRQNHFHWVSTHTAYTHELNSLVLSVDWNHFSRFSVFRSYFYAMKNVLSIEKWMNNQYLKWWEKNAKEDEDEDARERKKKQAKKTPISILI